MKTRTKALLLTLCAALLVWRDRPGDDGVPDGQRRSHKHLYRR